MKKSSQIPGKLFLFFNQDQQPATKVIEALQKESSKGHPRDQILQTKIPSSSGHYIWNASIIQKYSKKPDNLRPFFNQGQQPASKLISALQIESSEYFPSDQSV
jgi:hypothetical protein